MMTHGIWDLENLPWNLNDFAWKKGILRGCKDIISGLKDELKEADCVVIATDVDPSGEGELLAWEALEKCGWRGPTKRMYFADEAPASVQKAFRERKTLPSMDKDGDYVKAVVRERWDLASMQFTRAATLVARKKGFRTVVRQGRLKSVMVKLTGDQLKAYNEYVRKPFYEARFKDENGNIFARKTDDAEDIRFDSPDQVDLSQLHDSAVVEDSRAKKHTAPGKLLDLAGLSAILAKQGFKPANVLKTYQEMYENQIVSYPRTEDKEVTPEQFGELLPLVDKIAGVVGVDTSLLSHRAARKTHVNWSTDADLGTALDLAALYPQDEVVKYGTKLTFAGPWSAWCEDAGKTRCVSSTPGVYATAAASGSPILSATIKGNTTVYVDWPWSGYDGVMSARS